MYKLDLKDKKILYALDKNSRASFTNIGKEVGMAPENVRYRINSFLKNGIIKYNIAIINAAKLGASYYDVYIKLQNVDEKKKSEVISFFINSQKVTWIGDIEGTFDIAMIVMVWNQIELQEWMNEFHKKFSAVIMKKTVAINIRGEFLRRDYLVGYKREDKQMIKKSVNVEYSASEDLFRLDNIDAKICKSLATNSRISSVEIGKNLDISPDTAVLHIKKLMKENIITGFSIILDNEKIGQMHYKLFIYLNNISEDKTLKLLSFMRLNNRVIAIIKTLAEWDYEIDLEVDNISQLKEFTMEMTNNFSEIIRDYNTVRVLDMPKYNFYP